MKNEIIFLKCGKVQGEKNDGFMSYENIPYAKAPIGNLRFKPPVKCRSWEGVLDCSKHGFAAPQYDPFLGIKEDECNEDCLNLNVYTPIDTEKNCPIYFFVHGGGNTTGCGWNSGVDIRFFTSQGIICVSCNYRLGALGFLLLDEYLGEDYSESGNLALLDILAALQWVYDNIEGFGGDPQNITVGGCSAGAKNALAVSMMNSKDKLFTKMILSSGCLQTMRDKKTAHRVTDRYMKALGLDKSNAYRILTMPWQKIIKAQNGIITGAKNTNILGGVFDGINFNENNAADIISSKNRSDMKLIIGYCHDEFNLFSKLMGIDPCSRENAESLFGKNADNYLDYIRNSVNKISAASNYMYGNAVIQTADLFVHSGCNNIYMYRIDWNKTDFGACHGMETYIFAGNNPLLNDIERMEGYEELRAKMESAWCNFIKTGDPNNDFFTGWDKYSDNKQLMVFDTKSHMTDAPQIKYNKIPYQIFLLD